MNRIKIKIISWMKSSTKYKYRAIYHLKFYYRNYYSLEKLIYLVIVRLIGTPNQLYSINYWSNKLVAC